MIRSSNPALSDKQFKNYSISSAETMTINGTVNKTGVMLALVIMGAAITWGGASQGIGGLSILGAIAGFILALVIMFKKHLAPVLAPVYAICQGLFLGAISSVFEAQYPGIVTQAVGLTFGTCFCLLGAYKSGMIKVTENFKLGIVAATGGIAMFYFVSFILSMFGMNLSIIHGNGLFSIGFSVVVVVIAALSLVMDFDFIETASENGAPKYMEWYGAFGLMVTLIWLYMEILRLLAKLRSRD